MNWFRQWRRQRLVKRCDHHFGVIEAYPPVVVTRVFVLTPDGFGSRKMGHEPVKVKCCKCQLVTLGNRPWMEVSEE